VSFNVYNQSQASFPPAARLDEYVAIVFAPNDVRFAKVVWLEQIPLYEYSFLLQANQTLVDQELDKLEVGENEVLQLRFAIRGPGKVSVKLPRTTLRFSLKRESGYITEDIAKYPFFNAQTELHLLEDAHVFVTIQNLNTNHAERIKLYFTGWRLVFEEIREKPKAYTAMIVQGFAPRTRA
jgi:hypothetical protein